MYTCFSLLPTHLSLPLLLSRGRRALVHWIPGLLGIHLPHIFKKRVLFQRQSNTHTLHPLVHSPNACRTVFLCFYLYAFQVNTSFSICLFEKQRQENLSSAASLLRWLCCSELGGHRPPWGFQRFGAIFWCFPRHISWELDRKWSAWGSDWPLTCKVSLHFPLS